MQSFKNVCRRFTGRGERGSADGGAGAPAAAPGDLAEAGDMTPVGLSQASGGTRGGTPRRGGAGSAALPVEAADTLQVQTELLQQAKERKDFQDAIRLSLAEQPNTPQAATATATASAAAAPSFSEPCVPISPALPSAATAQESSSAAFPPAHQVPDGMWGDETRQLAARAAQALSELVANCISANSPFIDPDFAPGPKVLYANGRCRRNEADQLLIVQHYERNHGREIMWRRPGEILQRPDDLMMEFASQEEMVLTMHQMSRIVEWRVFQSDPSPMDISQGALGNCWFCGSLAAVAEKAALVKRLFVDECSKQGDLSPVGAYLVRLCDGGEWRFLVVDDCFPCNKSNMLAYSGARRNQLWVPLVEKAFAKLRGTYEETEGGNPSEGLRLLTGWPSVVIHLHNAEDEVDQRRQGRNAEMEEQLRYEQAMQVQASCKFVDEELLWARLVSACSAKLIMCGSCGHVEGISRDMYRSAGLSPSHCYSIVHVATAKNGAARLLKLRNPWGTGLKWKGEFSDGDHKSWTPEVKAEVGADDLGKDGGIFWMTLQDVRKYFNSITICPYQPGWTDRRIQAAFPPDLQGPQPAILLGGPTASSSTEVLLSLMQPEERATATTMTADLGLALFKVPLELTRTNSGARGEKLGASAAARKRLEFVDSIQRNVHDTMLRDHFLEENDGERGLLAVPLSFNQRVPLGQSSMPFEGPGAGAGGKRFTFACFSAREVPVHGLEIAPELLRDALVAHIQRHGSVTSQSNGTRLWKLAEAGLILYLENASNHFVELSVELTEVFNVTVSRGVVADSQGQLALYARDVITPMHGMVVLVAAAMPAGHTYRFSSRFVQVISQGDGPAHSPPLAEPYDALHSPFFLEGRGPQSRPQRPPRGYVAPLGLSPEEDLLRRGGGNTRL